MLLKFHVPQTEQVSPLLNLNTDATLPFSLETLISRVLGRSCSWEPRKMVASADIRQKEACAPSGPMLPQDLSAPLSLDGLYVVGWVAAGQYCSVAAAQGRSHDTTPGKGAGVTHPKMVAGSP